MAHAIRQRNALAPACSNPLRPLLAAPPVRDLSPPDPCRRDRVVGFTTAAESHRMPPCPVNALLVEDNHTNVLLIKNVVQECSLEVRISRREGRRNRGGTPLRSRIHPTARHHRRCAGVDLARCQMQD
jgi:hypothetical protein